MIKIKGLDGLTQQLKEAQQALSALDGELGSVHFDPNDPQSLESAIQQMETMIDDRVGAYADNPLVGPLIESLKEQYRERIIQKAAAARANQNP